ncbi:MAG: TetR/AcrR family transcriptional regulator [Hyphomonadaceae bacterium]|nr:TetR/AcrR family transcriptional regulator [Hyphomonadaceae bacterium]
MPAISAKRLQDRSDAILEAAQRVFLERGYQAASISEIARAANISDGLIYRYYENKRALLDAVLAAFFHRILARLEPAIAAETGFANKLRALIRTHLDIMLADPALCRLFIAEVRGAADFADSEARRLSQRYSEVFLRVIRSADAANELRKGVDAALLRDLVFGGVEHYSWRAMRARKASVESAAEKLADLVLGGVARTR